MIPTNTASADEWEDLSSQYEEQSELNQPTYTYKMNLERYRVQGNVDDHDAMTQVIYKILNTERYVYNKVYSDNYGVELRDLIGKDINYVVAEIPRLFKEALCWDQRITDVKDFEFERTKNSIAVNFTAVTVFGNLEIENVEVNF